MKCNIISQDCKRKIANARLQRQDRKRKIASARLQAQDCKRKIASAKLQTQLYKKMQYYNHILKSPGAKRRLFNARAAFCAHFGFVFGI